MPLPLYDYLLRVRFPLSNSNIYRIFSPCLVQIKTKNHNTLSWNRTFFRKSTVIGQRIVMRHASIVDALSVLMPKPIPAQSSRTWHNSSFMQGKSVEAKEEWLETLIKVGKSEKGEDIDTAAFNLVLDAWSYSNSSGSPQKTEYWVSRMEEYHTKLVSSEMSFDDAILGCNGEMGQHCEFSPLMIYSIVQPNVQSYNAVIRAWSRSKDEVALVRAERWLNKLQSFAILKSSIPANDNSQIRTLADGLICSVLKGPDTKSFNLFLKTCSRGLSKKQEILTANASKAEKILDSMIQNNENSSDFYAILCSQR